ncbi:MAG: hypothetical protein R3F05_00260 [Planctomycetota bacterium]
MNAWTGHHRGLLLVAALLIGFSLWLGLHDAPSTPGLVDSSAARAGASDAPGRAPLLASRPSGSEAAAPVEREAVAEEGNLLRSVVLADGSAAEFVSILVQRQGAWETIFDYVAPSDLPLELPSSFERIRIRDSAGSHWEGTIESLETQATVRLQAGHIVEGLVMNQGGSPPASSAWLILAPDPDVDGGPNLKLTTRPDAAGLFAFEPAAPGKYTIFVDSADPREGKAAEWQVEVPAPFLELRLAHQPAVTVRIVTPEGALLKPAHGVEHVLGIAREVEGPLESLRVGENPVVLKLPEDKPLRVYAFADGYEQSASVTLDPQDFVTPSEIDLMVRPREGGLARVHFDVDVHGPPASPRLQVNRHLDGRASPSTRVSWTADGVDLTLPSGNPLVLRFEPVLENGGLAHQYPFDPRTNSRAGTQVTVVPSPDETVNVRFPICGGIRLDAQKQPGRSLSGELRGQDRRIEFSFQAATSAVAQAVSPPLPPGRWELRVRHADYPEPMPVLIVPGAWTEVRQPEADAR